MMIEPLNFTFYASQWFLDAGWNYTEIESWLLSQLDSHQWGNLGRVWCAQLILKVSVFPCLISNVNSTDVGNSSNTHFSPLSFLWYWKLLAHESHQTEKTVTSSYPHCGLLLSPISVGSTAGELPGQYVTLPTVLKASILPAVVNFVHTHCIRWQMALCCQWTSRASALRGLMELGLQFL